MEGLVTAPRVVLAIRTSPDWAALARDSAAGLAIDPARFAAPEDIVSFPGDIAALIAKWDAISRVPFFECRRRLKEIAAATWRRVEDGRVLASAAVGGEDDLVFFCDDDDWVAPDLVARTRALETAGVDALVFPLIRLGVPSFTFGREGGAVTHPVGPVRPFGFRYQTNNYGLTRRAFERAGVASLIEHVRASQTADRLGFVDEYVPLAVSATNKTPCSASLLTQIVADREAFMRFLAAYLEGLKRLVIPAAHGWLAGPLWETIRLFEAVKPRR